MRLYLFILLLVLSGCCELDYDPSFYGDAPGSPGSEKEQSFRYRETFVKPYTEEDLSKTMPLYKLLDIALYNNPNTRFSWYAARAAAYAYKVSLAPYYPTVTYEGDLTDQKGNGSASVNGNNTIVTTTSTGNVVTLFNQVTGSYLLFDFGGRDAEAQFTWQMLMAANWQHNLAMQTVMLSVLNAYTSYIGNVALVKADELDLKDAEMALQAAVKMHQAGVATLTDVLSAQSTLEQFRFNLEQAKGAEKTSKAELLIALGLDPTTCICLDSLPDDLPVIEIGGNICALIELAKQKRPDIGAAIAQVKEQQAQLIIARSSGLPQFVVNTSTNSINFLKPGHPTLYNTTVQLNWSTPIFQGFYYVNLQNQIKAQIQEALANVDVTVANVVTGVVVNFYAFKTAEAALPSARALLESSSRAYRGMLSQYKVGASSILDVVNSLTTLSNARAQEITTRTQWAAGLANLAFSVGILTDDSGDWRKGPPDNFYRLNFKDQLK